MPRPETLKSLIPIEREKAEELIVTAYHGTTYSRALNIRDNGFNVGTRPGQWLGRGGVYAFLELRPYLSIEWAQEVTERQRRRGRVDEVPAVLQLKLRWTKDCFTLVERPDLIESLRDIYRAIPPEARPHGINHDNIGASQEHHLDDMIFTALYQRLKARSDEGLQALMHPFVEGDQLYPGSPLYTRAHVAIIILDLSIIESIDII